MADPDEVQIAGGARGLSADVGHATTHPLVQPGLVGTDLPVQLTRNRLSALLSATVLAFGACSASDGNPPTLNENRSGASTPGADPGSPQSMPGRGAGSPADSSEEPLVWGPTAGELAQARQIVSGWDADRLAGQVIVGRLRGTDPTEAAVLVRDLHLAGISVSADNVVDEAQVRALTRAVRLAAVADGRTFPAVIGVDQEGGIVAHLRGVATEFPAFAAAGAAITADPRTGRAVTRRSAYWMGLELRDLGFTWAWGPVADVTVGEADPTIGSRSPSSDPATAAAAVAAAVGGYTDAGIVSTTKHFPGHGSVSADSHETLPILGSSQEALRGRDLVPFQAAVQVGAPAVMVAHLDVRALAPGVPSTLAPEVYELLRDELGFEGVTVTDSLGMGGVAGQLEPGVRALNAGADLLLMPPDTRRTHRVVTRAIRTGEVSRQRAEEAAARVVALQLWQQRTAGEVPVLRDTRQRAARASAALSAAAY